MNLRETSRPRDFVANYSWINLGLGFLPRSKGIRQPVEGTKTRRNMKNFDLVSRPSKNKPTY